MGGKPQPAGVTVGERGGVLKLEVAFGPGALPAGTRVEARVLAGAGDVAEAEEAAPGGWLRPVGPVYTVEPAGGVPLAATVQVTVPYDAALLGDGDPEAICGALWNGAWWERRPSTVDATGHTVSLAADHFSPVTVVYERMYRSDTPGGTVLKAGHFAIHYAEDGPDAPLSNTLYTAHDNAPGGAAPAYVEDLCTYLEQAYVRIAAMGYAMPPEDGPLEAQIRDLHTPGVWQGLGLAEPAPLDGATGPWGPIYIDNQLRDEDGLRKPDVIWRKLKSTAAHEIFHVVQRYNPSFPTWFSEASAAFMEWRLYKDELPEIVPTDHINPRAAFLYNGLWRGSVNDHYAKAAFLIYLQENYCGNCRDILKDGIYPFGGSSYGIYVADLKDSGMYSTLAAAAGRCGGYHGNWASLLGEFARRYYVEWDRWPTAERLLLGNRGAPNMGNAEKVTGYQPEAFDWAARAGEGGAHRFPAYTWHESSAAMWRIATSADAPLGELVGSVPLGKGSTLEVTSPPDASVVAVVLADGFGNRGQPPRP